MGWPDLSKSVHTRTHQIFAEPVTLDGSPIRAVVDYDAEVMMGEVYDRRTLIEFLASDLAEGGIETAKGMEVAIGDKIYRLDQRIPAASRAIGQSAASTRWTELWVMR
jgi:hypothetical protein